MGLIGKEILVLNREKLEKFSKADDVKFLDPMSNQQSAHYEGFHRRVLPKPLFGLQEISRHCLVEEWSKRKQ